MCKERELKHYPLDGHQVGFFNQLGVNLRERSYACQVGDSFFDAFTALFGHYHELRPALLLARIGFDMYKAKLAIAVEARFDVVLQA